MLRYLDHADRKIILAGLLSDFPTVTKDQVQRAIERIDNEYIRGMERDCAGEHRQGQRGQANSRGRETGMRPSIQRAGFAADVTLMALAATGTVKADGTCRGLSVAPEHRCARYDREDYPYSQSVKAHIIANMGGQVYSPYTGVRG